MAATQDEAEGIVSFLRHIISIGASSYDSRHIHHLLNRLLLEDAQRRGAVVELFAPWYKEPEESLDTLPVNRLTTAFRFLAISGEAPGIAPYFPSLESADYIVCPDFDEAWPLFRDVLYEKTDRLHELMKFPIQGNVPARIAPIHPVLLAVRERHPRFPLALLEAGTAGGLNLTAIGRSCFVDADNNLFGDPDSPLRIKTAWRGTDQICGSNPYRGELDIVGRYGCDLNPIDPGTLEGRQRLLAAPHPSPANAKQLLGALKLARDNPRPVIDEESAETWIPRRLKESQSHGGRVTVLIATFVAQYLPDVWPRIEREIEEIGRQATSSNPMVFVTMDTISSNPISSMRVWSWPGDGRRIVEEYRTGESRCPFTNDQIVIDFRGGHLTESSDPVPGSERIRTFSPSKIPPYPIMPLSSSGRRGCPPSAHPRTSWVQDRRSARAV